ncbi:hypothetical protein BCR32DRAFT_324162 [Anaeromyces robustus]|uniref:ABC transmembrane type-1 domain-containing protein n=1 Tax=Anaeromyces robustus TaxID=1754192 RepID=A0A1Y1XR51_9FUNG|nr:hypothetical protein BCR32DRAFT_324162 [Anaeromyces robustus]|eukprot:ORX87966.1 hypothetical protein BCR32DRAFT_324162 [Anaeromyces robustus]
MEAHENTMDITDTQCNKDLITSKIINNKPKKDPPSKVSFINLFKYSNATEKIMISLGVIGSIGQGLTMPLIIYIMGNLINLFIGLVVSGKIREAAGVDQDDKTPIEELYIKIAMNLISAIISGLDTSSFQVPSDRGLLERIL